MPPAEITTVTQNSITAEIPQKDPSYGSWFAPIAAWASANGFIVGGDAPAPTETDSCAEVNKAAPTINITNPATGDSLKMKPSFEIIMNVEAEGGVDSVTVTVDGGTSYQASKMHNGNGYTATIPLSLGAHSVYATVKDAKGKSAQSATINVTVITVKP